MHQCNWKTWKTKNEFIYLIGSSLWRPLFNALGGIITNESIEKEKMTKQRELLCNTKVEQLRTVAKIGEDYAEKELNSIIKLLGSQGYGDDEEYDVAASTGEYLDTMKDVASFYENAAQIPYHNVKGLFGRCSDVYNKRIVKMTNLLNNWHNFRRRNYQYIIKFHPYGDERALDGSYGHLKKLTSAYQDCATHLEKAGMVRKAQIKYNDLIEIYGFSYMFRKYKETPYESEIPGVRRMRNSVQNKYAEGWGMTQEQKEAAWLVPNRSIVVFGALPASENH